MVEILDSRRVPVNARERAARPGNVPYYGATGLVGMIDRALFNEDLVLLGEDGVSFFDPHKPKAYRISGPSWVNNHAHVLRVGQHLDWRYLEHYLNAFDYRGYANGTTRLKLTQGAIRRIPVAYPSLPEQRRIVEILEVHLSKLDAGMNHLSAAEARLDAVESAYVSAEIGMAQNARLEDLLAEPLRSGRSVPTAEGGFPVLRLTAMHNGIINLSERKSGLWSRFEAESFLVNAGDVFVSRGNGSLRLVGRAAYVDGEPYPIAFPDTMIRVRPNRALIRPDFLVFLWNSRVVRRQIERLARTTAGIYKVNQGDLRSIQLPVPSLQQQASCVARMAELNERLEAGQRSVEMASVRAGSLRRSLLTAALS